MTRFGLLEELDSRQSLSKVLPIDCCRRLTEQNQGTDVAVAGNLPKFHAIGSIPTSRKDRKFAKPLKNTQSNYTTRLTNHGGGTLKVSDRSQRSKSAIEVSDRSQRSKSAIEVSDRVAIFRWTTAVGRLPTSATPTSAAVMTKRSR